MRKPRLVLEREHTQGGRHLGPFRGGFQRGWRSMPMPKRRWIASNYRCSSPAALGGKPMHGVYYPDVRSIPDL